MTNSSSGRYVAVGLGMMLGGHISPRSRSEIAAADAVYVLVSNPIVELWVREMRPDMQSLQPHYAEGKHRTRSYEEMIETMMREVRGGRRVCGVFYGHPGVFAQVPHHTIERARLEGFDAEMHPGISAEDCLYADLGIDPGRFGCQHYEASQFMFYRRRVDPSAHLVLWQIGVAGDRSVSKLNTGSEHRQILVDILLSEGYPSGHEVLLYEAATLPIVRPRCDRIRLDALPDASMSFHTTLVVPPAKALERNDDVLARLSRIEAGSRS